MVVVAIKIFRAIIRGIIRQRMFFEWRRLIWWIVVGVVMFLWINGIVTGIVVRRVERVLMVETLIMSVGVADVFY